MGEAKAFEVGDYDLRGPDFETLLVGAVTPSIVDADRLVRLDWSNGLPNWAMYRVAFAGDSHLRVQLRDTCVGFAVAYCRAGGIRKIGDAEAVGCLAGWDAYHALTRQKWVVSGEDVQDVADVDPKTYRRVRHVVFSLLRASLSEYWVRLQVAIRQVAMMEKRQDTLAPEWSTYSLGRGIGEGEMGADSSGNYINPPRGSGC